MSRRVFLALALAIAVALAFAASPYASSSPDGLERVATDKGFVERGKVHSAQHHSPIAHYAFPGIHDPRLATGLAGFVGTMGVFALGYGMARVTRRTRP